jgi:hypothetical protein
MAILVRYTPTGLTREKYDRVNEILQSQGDSEGPPEAVLLHVLFGDEPNMRVSEIWSDEEQWRAFFDGPLASALSEVGVGSGADPELLPVHAFWGARISVPI